MRNTNWLSEFQNAKDSAIYSLDLLRVIAHNLRAVGLSELADSISEEATAAKFFVESMGDCVSDLLVSVSFGVIGKDI